MSDTKTLIVQFPTVEEYEQLKKDAYKHEMNISSYIRYLVAKERKLIEPYVPATSSSEKWFNAMLKSAKEYKIETDRILAKEREEREK